MAAQLVSLSVAGVGGGRGRVACVGGVHAAAAVLLVAGACGLAVVALPGSGAREAVRAGVVGQRGAGAGLPLAAQGPVSRILGRDDASYRAVETASGVVLRNSGQRLRAWFGSRGVVVRAGGAWLGVRLNAYGYGDRLQPVGPVSPRARANRVVYRRGGLEEWYANGPLGLEQGFTLAARAAGGGAGPVTLALALSGNLRAALARGAGSVMFSRPGVSLAYRGLIATDARGRQLPARIELRGDRLLLAIDDRGARYPLRVDPFLQLAKLTASDGAAGDGLGGSVAISGDTIVVGAPLANVDGHNLQGAVYVFVKPGPSWADEIEAAKLTASDGAVSDRLGSSVAISGDTVVAGAPEASLGGRRDHQGAVYVFVKPGSGWSGGQAQQAKLTVGGAVASDHFGFSVAIDGDTVVAGAAPTNAILARDAAYVFVKPRGGWSGEQTQRAKLTASDEAAAQPLGRSVAISVDTVVVGAPFATVGTNASQGAAYVFVKPATANGWAGPQTEQAKLTVSGGRSHDEFGTSVAISGDTVVAGAPLATVGDNRQQGVAYVFVKPATVKGWAGPQTEQAKLVASDGAAGQRLGSSVAISGETVVAGAPACVPKPASTCPAVGANAGQGAAYVFNKPPNGWGPPDLGQGPNAKLTASDGAAGDGLGSSVALSGDTVVAGAPGATVAGNDSQGAAYVFSRANTTSTSVSCSPSSVAVGQPSTCTATVTDTAIGGLRQPGRSTSHRAARAASVLTRARWRGRARLPAVR